MNYYQSKCDGITHTIRPGDTLYRLSRLYGVALETIMDANPDVNIYNMAVGGTICIPMAPGMSGKAALNPLPGSKPATAAESAKSPEEEMLPEPAGSDSQQWQNDSDGRQWPSSTGSQQWPSDADSRQWQTGAGLDWMIIMPYEVKMGDSLNSILKDFDMDFETFAAYNPKLMPIKLDKGETVYVKRKRTIL
ncbi:MAG: LysM peptidoglycan-binding domain-containing protein [Clostridiales bacterium]|nr:LysM peptidoglycan-binding domain-containing protein [Clostridiales bacterium]